MFLRDAPIKRKLMVVILLTTSFALLFLATVVISYEVLTFRANAAASNAALGKVMGSLISSAVAFENPDDASELLALLAGEPEITATAVYTASGRTFARYPPDAGPDLIPETPRRDGAVFRTTYMEVYQPVLQNGTRMGTMYIRSDLREMYKRLLIYGGLVILAGLAAFSGAIAVSTTLQRRVALPIIELAKVATAVSERQDYSVRAARHGRDEIGDLTDAFNQMLVRVGDAREALAASEERLRLALEGSETGTWDWNLRTNRLTWDNFMFPLYNVSKANWSELPEEFFALVHPEDRERVERSFWRAVQERRDLKIEFRIHGTNDEVRHMACRGRVFLDANETPLRMSGVSMDITAARHIQEALRQAKDSAEAANRAKDEFLAILSHELRTPLTPVLATIAVLEEDAADNPELSRDLEMIRRNVEVEARLIDDLLDVTRISRGKLEMQKANVDLCALLDHSLRHYLNAEAARKKLLVSVEIDPGAKSHIHADGSRITQVLWNLLQNACKFTPDGGSIHIRLGNEPRPGAAGETPDVFIRITDTGIGIHPDVLPRIFDAFEQGERSRARVFGGLGLGLAISRALVDMHGGTLTATSSGTGQGSTFELRLPTIAESEEISPAPVPRDASPEPIGASPGRHPLKILLVEDHADSAQQLTRLLRRAGHDVTYARSIAEARALAASANGSPFDLVLSDLGLPDGSGHELMRELADRYRVPGIALSGYGMEEDIQRSLAAGFYKHLTKPVNWSELKASIESITMNHAS